MDYLSISKQRFPQACDGGANALPQLPTLVRRKQFKNDSGNNNDDSSSNGNNNNNKTMKIIVVMLECLRKPLFVLIVIFMSDMLCKNNQECKKKGRKLFGQAVGEKRFAQTH